jgi:hypothetical protein
VDVLSNRHGFYEPEVLVDHPDPSGDGLRRGVEFAVGAVHEDPASVGTVEAGKDVRQRRLPGAVLTQQGMHFALGYLKIDCV